jgi:hypothetical protein
MKRYLLAATILAALSTPSAASLVSFTFAGPFGSGSINGRVVVDVEGGLATSGTATMQGWGIDGTQTLALVTPAGAVYRSGNGTDIWDGDNRVPITWGGIVFGTNAATSGSGGYNLGIWAETPATYRGFASGPGLWSYTGELSVNPIPELSTWAMFAIGAAAIAFTGYRKPARYAL